MEEQAGTIRHLSCEPFMDISAGLEKIARELNALCSNRVEQVHCAIHINPEAAITDACSLVETVCKHILRDKLIDLPSDQSIQSLWKSVTKSLGSTPAEQADPELRGMCGGLFTVAQN